MHTCDYHLHNSFCNRGLCCTVNDHKSRNAVIHKYVCGGVSAQDWRWYNRTPSIQGQPGADSEIHRRETGSDSIPGPWIHRNGWQPHHPEAFPHHEGGLHQRRYPGPLLMRKYRKVTCKRKNRGPHFYPNLYPLQLFQRFTTFYSETEKALKPLCFFYCILHHFQYWL